MGWMFEDLAKEEQALKEKRIGIVLGSVVPYQDRG